MWGDQHHVRCEKSCNARAGSIMLSMHSATAEAADLPAMEAVAHGRDNNINQGRQQTTTSNPAVQVFTTRLSLIQAECMPHDQLQQHWRALCQHDACECTWQFILIVDVCVTCTDNPMPATSLVHCKNGASEGQGSLRCVSNQPAPTIIRKRTRCKHFCSLILRISQTLADVHEAARYKTILHRLSYTASSYALLCLVRS
jgi:hypothetical protein